MMRKFLISAVLAATTLTTAAPAAAQWAPPPPPVYGNPYGAPYGNAYGYNNYGQVRSLQARLQQIRHEIRQLDRRNILSEREANRLRAQERDISHTLVHFSRNGLNGRERYEIERRIVRLEQNVRFQARDGNRYGWGYGRGQDDRWQDQHNRWHDRNDGHDHRDRDHDDDDHD